MNAFTWSRLGENIARRRKECGFTQEKLAERLSLTAQAVSKWENGSSLPETSLLPALAEALDCDINTLFSADPPKPLRLPPHAVPDLAYDAVLSLTEQARYPREDAIKSAAHLDRCVEALKEQLASPPLTVGMIKAWEQADERGAVLVSDAFTFIDRTYASPDSAALFDSGMTGELLTVLGDAGVRTVLKFLYLRMLTGGEQAASTTPEEISSQTGLSPDVITAAAVKLRHIRLLEETEKIHNGVCCREYSVAYIHDFPYILALLRLGYLFRANRDM